MSTLCSHPPSARFILRGRLTKPRTTPLAQWLTDSRNARGLTMQQLAERAGMTSHARISQIEAGGSTKPDMIRRLAAAMAEDEHVRQELEKEGLRAAFIPADDEELTDPRFAVVREAFNNADDEDREYLTETAKRLQKARLAQDAARRGAIGRGSDTD